MFEQPRGDRRFAQLHRRRWLQPSLADSWTWAPDSMSIAFHLDPKARWHDGVPVRAADVVYSYRVNTSKVLGTPVGPLLENIDSVTARDSLTAVVWFHARKLEQFYDATMQIRILPAHLLASIPDSALKTSTYARSRGQRAIPLRAMGQWKQIEMQADSSFHCGRPKSIASSGASRRIPMRRRCDCSPAKPTSWTNCAGRMSSSSRSIRSSRRFISLDARVLRPVQRARTRREARSACDLRRSRRAARAHDGARPPARGPHHLSIRLAKVAMGPITSALSPPMIRISRAFPTRPTAPPRFSSGAGG